MPNSDQRFLMYSLEHKKDSYELNSYGNDTVLDRELWEVKEALEHFDKESAMNGDSNFIVADIGVIDSDFFYAVAYKLQDNGSIYKLEDGTLKEILNENEESFEEGVLGCKKSDGDLTFACETGFSFVVSKMNNFGGTSMYNSDSMELIQNSTKLKNTTIEVDSSKVKKYIQKKNPEEKISSGMEGSGLTKRLIDITGISKTGRLELNIPKDEWIDNDETILGLLDLGFVEEITVKIPQSSQAKFKSDETEEIRDARYAKKNKDPEEQIIDIFDTHE